jgi:prepilin-type N-terminal cleavage/methylation domain-containing protein/prepilin-type processing-associated H-X9-DG protein
VQRRQSGFTLIELLVVIAIIGILAAMLFPVFARARESARKTQCLANVKNIAMAIQIYLSDYDRFPPGNTDQAAADALTEVSGGHQCRLDFSNSPAQFWKANPYLRWPVILDEYIKSREVWRCPSQEHVDYAYFILPQYTPIWYDYLVDNPSAWGPTSSTEGPCMEIWPTGWGGSITDSLLQQNAYTPGEGAFVQSVGYAALIGRGASEISDPSSLLVVSDNGQGSTNINLPWQAVYQTTHPDCCLDLSDADVQRFWYEPGFRKKYAPHMGGLNLGFADGHAKWWDAEAFLAAAGACCCTDSTSPYATGDKRTLHGVCPDLTM